MRLTLHYNSRATGTGKINVTVPHCQTAKERSKAAHEELRAKGLHSLVGIIQKIEIRKEI